MPPRRASEQSSPPSLPVPGWIARKRDGGVLDQPTIEAFLKGAVDKSIPEYQVAAMLMAIVWRGLSPGELSAWTRTMIASGDRLSLGVVAGAKIDKHSTGGVGDKITLPLAPLVAACGVNAPMLVGRALGHTGGTLDKLESIPGFRAQLTPAEFVRVLARAGFVIAGQTPRIVPADRLLYALRDATATVESIPLIASSILSKKIAGGADGLVMDVKVGRGAFLPTLKQGRALARTIVDLGNQLGLHTVALLTAMDQPLGVEVGNALEVKESLSVLRGEGPPDVHALTVRLGAEMLVLGGVVRTVKEGSKRIEGAMSSGAGYERFLVGVRAQGGDVRVLESPERLPRARKRFDVKAAQAGHLDVVDARLIGQAVTLLGAGRQRKEDVVDHAVGLSLRAKTGDVVARGQPLATVWFNDEARFSAAKPLLTSAFQVVDDMPEVMPLVVQRVQ